MGSPTRGTRINQLAQPGNGARPASGEDDPLPLQPVTDGEEHRPGTVPNPVHHGREPGAKPGDVAPMLINILGDYLETMRGGITADTPPVWSIGLSGLAGNPIARQRAALSSGDSPLGSCSLKS